MPANRFFQWLGEHVVIRTISHASIEAGGKTTPATCCCSGGGAARLGRIQARVYWPLHGCGSSSSSSSGWEPKWRWPFDRLTPESGQAALERLFNPKVWPGATLYPGQYLWKTDGEVSQCSSSYDGSDECDDLGAEAMQLGAWDEGIGTIVHHAHPSETINRWEYYGLYTWCSWCRLTECYSLYPPNAIYKWALPPGRLFFGAYFETPLVTPPFETFMPNRWWTEITVWNESYARPLYVKMALPGQPTEKFTLLPRKARTWPDKIPYVGVTEGMGEPGVTAYLQTALQCDGLVLQTSRNKTAALNNTRNPELCSSAPPGGSGSW